MVSIRWIVNSNNPCFEVVNNEELIRTIMVSIWIWLLLFLFFASNRSRLILLVFSLIILAFALNVDRSPLAAGESAAVGHMKNLAWEVEAYRKQHPEEGYPKTLPTITSLSQAVKAEKLYEIGYKTFHSNPDGPADGYLIQITPIWRQCGYVRSFLVNQGGMIHFTLDPRPATASDPTIQ